MNISIQCSCQKFIGYLAFAGVLVGVDQFTKYQAYIHLIGQPPIEVLPVFHFALVFNHGAAFGFLAEAGGWQHYVFVSLAIGISCFIVWWLWRVQHQSAILCWGLALILSGAIGNLIDRVRFQFVIDFILLHYQNWYFPAFNVADIAITCGALLFILDGFRSHSNSEER